MRTPKDIVEDYRKRGYSDEKIRIIALSRPESVRGKILEFLEAHPADTQEPDEVITQYLPLRKDDEGVGGTGAVPEEEPRETQEEAAQPIEVPDETPEPVGAPIPMSSASSDEDASESSRILALARDEDLSVDLSSVAPSEVEEAEEDDASQTAEPICADVRADLSKAKRREARLSRKIETLSVALKEKDERVRALEAGSAEAQDGARETDELRQRLEERDASVRDLELKLEGSDAKLEETVTSHIEEMHRIIDAYEVRIKAVRAQGLKGSLVAFASAACVLLVFLVSLTVRGKQPDVRLIPVDVAVENANLDETPAPALTADNSPDLPGMIRAREAGTTHAFDLRTGQTFAVSDGAADPDRTRRASTASTTPSPAVSSSSTPPSQDAQTIRYVVRKNDTLWSICKKYLGSGNHYRDVARDNRLPSMRLQPGQVLVINLKHKD
ncbi:MAG: LysM peptidoglycan-binding domain-containing protein [Planctomycetota bacterium]